MKSHSIEVAFDPLYKKGQNSEKIARIDQKFESNPKNHEKHRGKESSEIQKIQECSTFSRIFGFEDSACGSV